MTREAYLNRMLEKQSEYHLSIAREAITEMHDRFVEGMVYHGDPLVSSTVRSILRFISYNREEMQTC